MDKYNTLPPHIKPEGSHLRYHCSNGRSFIFDRCDLPFFVGTMCTVDERGYVTANRKKDLISHILLGVGSDSVVDHINGDPFDNRRSNLRVATIFQNHWNYKIQLVLRVFIQTRKQKGFMQGYVNTAGGTISAFFLQR